MNEWKPIESADNATRDEDVVLLYADGYGVQPGYWDDEFGWLALETQSLTGGKMTPTHYALLPAPPVDEKATQG